MKYRCPHSDCPDHTDQLSIKKHGSYFRPSDGRSIQRFFCHQCSRSFSLATFDPAYRQNKRRINTPLERLLCSGVSMRRSAFILGVQRKTIARKLRFLALRAKNNHAKFLRSLPPVLDFQFDDLITIEHTKCKPLSVTLAVEKTNRKILALHVSSMPATGHLAAISRKKYGLRADDRLQGIETVLRKVAAISSPQTKITSDEHPFYPLKVKTFFPQGLYTRVKGKRGCVAGQGELKKVKHDPLFSLNHTCAMFRANVNRLFRRTWCTTKCPKALLDHLIIYMHFHNAYLTP